MALRQNPLSKQLLESLTSATVGDITSLPTYALRAQLNFHRTEYLHNLHIAQIYSQRARHSEQISESAFTALASRMDTEDGPENEIITQMSSRSSSDDLSTSSESGPSSVDIVTDPEYTSSAPASL